MSKLLNRYSLGLTLTVGVALFAVYQSDKTIEDVGEQIALKILEIIPRKSQQHKSFLREESSTGSGNSTEEDSLNTEDSSLPAGVLSKGSSFNPAGSAYNAKEAMQKRFENFRESCLVYTDFMRPERLTTEVTPELEDLHLHPRSDLVFCPLQQVASKSFETLFSRIKEPGNEMEGKIKGFKTNYPRSARDKKRAIVVRHPLERLVSAYRHNFEKSFNAATNEEEGGDISFPEFVDIVLGGHIEFAEFLEENQMTGESVAIDTGMIDGEGLSKAWNPYWKQCGLCHPDFQPHYIMHLEHFREDAQVLLEIMGNPKNGNDFLKAEIKPKSGLREIEEHYFSMLTKSEIKQLYEKYKIDHELFGYSPDYYIQMGQDE